MLPDCPRCEGCLLPDRSYEFLAFHCMNCGTVLDPVILQNSTRRPNVIPVEQRFPIAVDCDTDPPQDDDAPAMM
jgi:uncharacterized Zn finger protein